MTHSALQINQYTMSHIADNDGLHRNSDVPDIGDQLREAAVLVPLVAHKRAWHVLFIRRAHRDGDRHSGQVAFPGGAREAQDTDLVQTALRETWEEIGLENGRISLLGELMPYATVSDFAVTPVVGVAAWPSPLTLETSEVARAFLIPLAWLRNRENFTLKPRRDIDTFSKRKHPIVVFDPYDGEILWGATARMTLNFIKALDDGHIVLPRLP